MSTYTAYGELGMPEVDISGTIYHRDRVHGDSVSVGVVNNNTYVGERELIWTDTYADEGAYVTDKTPT